MSTDVDTSSRKREQHVDKVGAYFLLNHHGMLVASSLISKSFR